MKQRKTMKTSCPIVSVCMAENEEQKEQLYLVCFCPLVFKILSLLSQRLCNPFISIDEHKGNAFPNPCLKLQSKQSRVLKAIQQAKKFEELENLYEKNLQLIRQTRRAIFYKRSFYKGT